LPAAVASASYRNRLWAAPFTSNAQLLWYRTDRVKSPPSTWDEMIATAEATGRAGVVEAQGERYEGLTVFFVSLLASAGGTILDEEPGSRVALPDVPTRAALGVMKRLATSPATAPALPAAREDQARLAFETGVPDFMVNYSYVWPSARTNAPEIAKVMGWARWPGMTENHAGRVAIGGLNLGISARSRHPDLAFQAAACLVSPENQKLAAERGGLPPTVEALYDDPAVRRVLPFADVLRDTLRDAVERPKTPLYNDISLAIVRILHPMRDIDPLHDGERLRAAITRALRSEGLL
jgi:multiple sugar transport system substrate-binding protein